VRRLRHLRALALAGLGLAACRQDMHDQPRFEPLEAGAFFADGRSARPRVEGTVARGEREVDELLATGRIDGEFAAVFPFPVTADVLQRGRERYEIFCSACHDRTGSGLGIVVRRGLKAPPSLHEERLRAAQPGYFFDVMTHGFGAMYDVADRVVPRDRWAIAAWVRVLQRSQAATLEDVPEDRRTRLQEELR
jgi:mono/diheme cytochrome c family protein